jgi:hypothetical protein
MPKAHFAIAVILQTVEERRSQSFVNRTDENNDHTVNLSYNLRKFILNSLLLYAGQQ